jgi:Raf kinase inhibitor-like YbhB/YbcL family protein
MYRKSLSNLLGGSLLVATISALNACGSDPGTGDETSSGGAPASTGAGTPATVGSAGKPAGSAGSTATAGARATAGTSSTTSPVSTAGRSGSAGTAAAAGTSAAGTVAAAAGTGAAAGSVAAAGASAAAGTGAAGSTAGGTLGTPLKYTGMFTMGTSIDAKYKCPSMGDNVSPALEWTGGPADTKSFAIVLFDTTYRMLHWAIWDIPVTVNKLPEGLAAGYELTDPMGAHQAANMCGMEPAYCGPCSGMGIIAAGTYEYRLYAMKVDKLGLTESSSATEAQTAIEGMMLEKAVWSGMPVSM